MVHSHEEAEDRAKVIGSWDWTLVLVAKTLAGGVLLALAGILALTLWLIHKSTVPMPF